MTDKQFCSEMFGKAAQALDEGVTPEELLKRLELRTDERLVFDTAMLYFAMRMVRSTREAPSEN